MSSNKISIQGIEGLPEIEPGDNIGDKIVLAMRESPNGRVINGSARILSGTVFVVAQKIISKSENRIVALNSVEPSARAQEWAIRYQKDPRLVEIVLQETHRVVRMERGIIIAETRHGFICANAGVDVSNAPRDCVVLLPEDPDGSARNLRRQLEASFQVPVAVIISDTFGRPWRRGLTNVALGVSGLSPFIDYRGQIDFHGRILRATVMAVADELAAAAELVMGKTRGVPIAVIEGSHYRTAEGFGRELVRPPQEDLFRH